MYYTPGMAIGEKRQIRGLFARMEIEFEHTHPARGVNPRHKLSGAERGFPFPLSFYDSVPAKITFDYWAFSGY